MFAAPGPTGGARRMYGAASGRGRRRGQLRRRINPRRRYRRTRDRQRGAAECVWSERRQPLAGAAQRRHRAGRRGPDRRLGTHHGRLCAVAAAGRAPRSDHRAVAARAVAAAAPFYCAVSARRRRRAARRRTIAVSALAARPRRYRPVTGSGLALGGRRAPPVHRRDLAELAGRGQAPLPSPRPRFLGGASPSHRARDRCAAACRDRFRPGQRDRRKGRGGHTGTLTVRR